MSRKPWTSAPVYRHALSALVAILCCGLAVMSVAHADSNGAGPGKTPDAPILAGSLVYYSSADASFRLLDFETGGSRVIPIEDGHQPALSPDLKKIAYIGKSDQLHVLWLEHGREVVFKDDRCSYASPLFVGNNTVAYLKEDRKGIGLYLSPADRVAERVWRGKMPELTFFGAISWVPGSGEETPSFALAHRGSLYYISAGEPRLLIKDEDPVRYPSVSPDGRSVAFVRTIPEGVWAIDIDGRNLRLLSQEDKDASWPAWSPDGRYIAYLSTAAVTRGLSIGDQSTGHEVGRTAGFFLMSIWIRNADGSNPVALLSPEGKPLHTRGDNVTWQ